MKEKGTTLAEVSEKVKLSVCLLAFAGLPGAGKSTLANKLADNTYATLIDIDTVRSDLFPQFKRNTINYDTEKQQMFTAYQIMYQLAAKTLKDGRPTILAATFSSQKSREEAAKIAKGASVPLLVFLVEAPINVLEERLLARQSQGNNFSNVTSFTHLQEVQSRFVEMHGDNVFRLDTTKTQDSNLRQLLEAIERFKVG